MSRQEDKQDPQMEEETEEYSSSSESEESEEEEPVTPTPPPPPPPPPVKKKKPKVKQPVFEPPTKEYTEVHHPPVKKKKKKKKKNKDEEEEQVQEEEEMEVDEEEIPPTPPLPPPVQKKKRKKPEVMTVPTNNPNVVVQVKKRKPGPKTQNVIIYEEDLPQPKIKLIKKTHKKGRPKTKAEVIMDQGMVEIQDDRIVIDRPAQKTKEMSARQLKRMELDAKFVEMEQIAGRKLRQTKTGKIDKRCVKERSPAQIAAARRLAEYNKELRRQKALEKNKSAVKEVISELAVVQHLRDKDKKEQKQQEQQQAPATFNLFAN
mgnify:CR=1 FL=1